MKVIIPCWLINQDLIDLTISAIESIRFGGDTQFILIDNGSPMGGGMLRELADVYIHNKENLGYAKAVNQGLKLCDKGEVVCIANNDIRVPPQWRRVAEEIIKDPKVGSVHFRMIGYNKPFSIGNDIWIGGKERWCTSSFFVVQNIQLYDEDFFNSYDDWDYWLRMRKQGFKQAYTNKVEYQHNDSFTQQFVPQRKENDARNREHFKIKHGDYPEALFEKEFPHELAKSWRPFP